MQEKFDKIDTCCNNTERLKLIWMWSKQNAINFKEFDELIYYFIKYYKR